jgi:hypothetical protein
MLIYNWVSQIDRTALNPDAKIADFSIKVYDYKKAVNKVS